MFSARSLVVRPLLLAAALAVAPLACTEADPARPATWIGKLQDSDPAKVIEALNQLRKMKAKEAVNVIIPFLKSDNGEIEEAAAWALGELGDKTAVDPLIQAIDLASTKKAADRANYRIADALGELGDPKAVPDLIKMTSSRVQLVQLHAVQALGKLKDPRATPILLKFVTEDDAPPFITHSPYGSPRANDQQRHAAVAHRRVRGHDIWNSPEDGRNLRSEGGRVQ